MKVWYFLQWQWRQFEFWQKAWLFGAMLFGAGVATSNEKTRLICFSTALGIYGICICKWLFWDGIRDQWLRFNKEQQKIVDIMKEGPK